jgi:lysophospholipase L1-like esterase
MRSIRPLLLAAGLATLLAGPTLLQPARAQNQQMEPADVAAPKRGPDGQINARFQEMHESFLKRGKEGPIGVLFLGDSITQGWTRASEVWQEHFGKYQPANFGIGGDRTQHVLWRIENGELEGIHPKVVVLMIGTNNIGYPAEEITKGDKKIVEEIRRRLPDTRILLLGIFPRGADPKNPTVAGARAKLKAVNSELAKLDDGKKIRYLDIGDKFLDAEGNLPADIMPDALHPNVKGYQIWAEAIQPMLDEMMK